MSGWEKCVRALWVLFLVGVSAIALAVGVGPRTSPTLEINSHYEAAVTSQSKAGPLAFIRTFSSSDLVGTLIATLKPEVARQVCADLQAGGPRKAREACEKLQEAFTTQAYATATEIGPAVAGIAVVNPVSAGADTSAGVPSKGEPRDGQGAGASAKVGDTDPLHSPVAATAPTESVAAVTPMAASAVPPASDREPGDGQGAGDPEKLGETHFLHRWLAVTAPTESLAVAPASASAVPSASDHHAGTDKVGGTHPFHHPVAATTESIAAATPMSASVVIFVPFGDNSHGGQGTGDPDKVDDTDPVGRQVAATAPTEGVAAVTPMSVSAVPSASNTESQGDQSAGDRDQVGGTTAPPESVVTVTPMSSSAVPSASNTESQSDQDAGEGRIWYERGLATVTVGYDPAKNQTLHRKYYLVAYGPKAVEEAAQARAKECAKDATITGVTAEYNTPGEAATKTSAAITAFKAKFYRCFTFENFASNHRDDFWPGIAMREVWVKGLHLKYMADSESAKMYASIYHWLDKQLPPGPARDLNNSVAVFYPTMAAATRTNVDVKLKVAGEFEEASKWTSGVSKEAASKMMVSLAKEASKAGKQIAKVAVQTMRIPQDVASNLSSVQVKSR